MASVQKGKLPLLNANPGKFGLLDTRVVGEDSWAHVAVTWKYVAVWNHNSVVVLKWAYGAVKVTSK